MRRKRTDGSPAELDRSSIVAAAVMEMDASGEAKFSLRKVAARLGCDPMAVIYHMGSREGLERAIAEAINSKVPLPGAGQNWRQRLAEIADGYRTVAHLHPNSFPLLQRFWATGPSDYVVFEAVYGALAEAGFGWQEVDDYGSIFFSAVLGFCTAEVRGMLSTEMPSVAASEVEKLTETNFPNVMQIMSIAQSAPDALWERARGTLLDGIALHLSQR